MKHTKLFVRNATLQDFILEPYNPIAATRTQFFVMCKGLSPANNVGSTLVWDGEVDDCIKIRLQYPRIPDFDESPTAAISFVWERHFEDVEKNFQNLEKQAFEEKKSATADLEKIAAVVTKNLPNSAVDIKLVSDGNADKANVSLISSKSSG